MKSNPNKHGEGGQRKNAAANTIVGRFKRVITSRMSPADEERVVVSNRGEASDRKLTRREMVERLLTGMAAGAAWPLIAASHPLHQHANNGTVLDRADAAQKAAAWKPLFLDQEQNEMLVALSEGIVPGSAMAHVNRFIDLLLSVDTAENRQKFVASLAAIDSESQRRSGKAFHHLTTSEAEIFLTRVSTEGPQKEHFDHLRDWVTVAYYSSEEGMRELGWDGKHAFRVFPGCEHAGETH